MIAENFSDKNNLQNIRLTSKDLCAAAARPFSCLFKRRRHVVTLHSLETLVKITEHPIFGPKVEEVSLGTAAIPKGFVFDVTQYLMDTSSNYADELFDYMHDFEDYEAYISSESPLQLLRQAFENIKGHGNRLTVGVFDDHLSSGYGATAGYDFAMHLYDGTVWRSATIHDGASGGRIWYHGSDRTGPFLELLRAAARDVAVPLRKVELDFDMSSVTFDDDREEELECRMESLIDALSNTLLEPSGSGRLNKSFAFELSLRNISWCRGSYDADATMAYNSNHLYLTNWGLGTRHAHRQLYPSLDRSTISALADAVLKTPFRKVVLKECLLVSSAWLEWLRASRHTLVDYHLQDVRVEGVRNTTAQSDILSYIKDNMALQHLKIEFKSNDDDFRDEQVISFYDDTHPQSNLWEAHGVQEVQSMLEELVTKQREWEESQLVLLS